MSVKYVTRRAEDKKWCVKNAKASKATRVFSTQKEAIQYAGSLKSTTSIMVQSKEGKFRKVSTWDGVKTSKEEVKKPVTKKETSAKKVASVKTKPIVEEENTQISTKERVIQELKAQNDALDAQLKREAEEKEIAEKEQVIAKEEKAAAKEEKAVAKEEAKAEKAKLKEEKADSKEGKKTNKVMLALGILFFLAVIAVAVLFVADWKEWSWALFDVIKKK